MRLRMLFLSIAILFLLGCQSKKDKEQRTDRLAIDGSRGVESSNNKNLSVELSSPYWSSLNGPCSDDVLSVLVLPDGDILAGTGHSIVISRDHGQNWKEVYGPCLYVTLLNNDSKGNIVARLGSGYEHSIFSTDNGNSWQSILMNGDSIAKHILISELGSIMFQDKKDIWYHTEDLGKSWSRLSIPKGVGEFYTIGFRKDKQAITITRKKKILYSSDDGKSWTSMGTEYPYGYHTVRILDNGELLVIMGNGTIYRSNNRGASWTEGENENLSELFAYLGGGHIIVASGKGLLESSDYGTTLKSLGLPNTHITSIAFDADSNIIVGMYSQGIYRLDKAHTEWIHLTTGWSPSTVTSIAYATDSVMYVSTNSFGIYRTTNAGHSWRALSETVPDKNIKSVLVGPRGESYALSEYGAIRSSTDQGKTWNDVGISPRFEHDIVLSIAVDSSGVLYAGMMDGGILRFSDTERKLISVADTMGRIEQLVYDKHNNCFYGLFVDFVPRNEGLHSGDDRVGTIQKSTDGCKSWTELCPQNGGVETISLDNRGSVFIGTDSSGILCSTDQGVHWQRLGLDSVIVSSIAICDSTTIVVGTMEDYILATTDYGKSWVHIDNGLPPRRRVNFVSMDGQSYLYVGGWGFGIIKSVKPYGDLLRVNATK